MDGKDNKKLTKEFLKKNNSRDKAIFDENKEIYKL